MSSSGAGLGAFRGSTVAQPVRRSSARSAILMRRPPVRCGSSTSLPSRMAKARRPSTRSSASRPNSSKRQPSRIASPSRRPAASSSSSSDLATRRGATLHSRALILSSSFSRSATSAPSRPRPGPALLARRQLGRRAADRRWRAPPSSARRYRCPSRRPTGRAPGRAPPGSTGGCMATSASVSSFMIRPRGRFLPRASSSRQAASAFSRPSASGLRVWILTRFQASAGSLT